MCALRWIRTTSRRRKTPPASADVIIACDLVVASSGEALVMFDKGRTSVVANHDVTPTKEFIEDRNARFDPDLLTARVRSPRKVALRRPMRRRWPSIISATRSTPT